jgi:hypothetical protein
VGAPAPGRAPPSYPPRDDWGLEAAVSLYPVVVCVAGVVWGCGGGRSTRIAARAAAEAALARRDAQA